MRHSLQLLLFILVPALVATATPSRAGAADKERVALATAQQAAESLPISSSATAPAATAQPEVAPPAKAAADPVVSPPVASGTAVPALQGGRSLPRLNPNSAQVNGVGKGTLQVGVGVPALVQVTAAVGVLAGISAGLEIRNTSVPLTEFELLAAYRLATRLPFVAGVQAGLGAGIGTKERNSFTFSARSTATLFVGEFSSVSVFGQFRFFTDRYQPGVDRDTGVQVPVGFLGEYRLKNQLNLWARLEIDFANSDGRRIYGEVSEVLNSRLRGGLGVTLPLN